jgi:hypothetical protein
VGEARRVLALRIAGIAARFFQMQREETANGLLNVAARVDETAGVRPLRPRTVLDVHTLDARARAFVASARAGGRDDVIAHRAPEGTWMWGALIPAGGLLAWTALSFETAWTLSTALLSSGVLALVVVPVVLAMRALLHAWRGDDGFSALGAHLLVRVHRHDVELFPLPLLADVRATHQHEGERYLRTVISLRFGATAETHLVVRGKERALAWCKLLTERRALSLALLSHGQLDRTFAGCAPVQTWRGASAPTLRAQLGWAGLAALFVVVTTCIAAYASHPLAARHAYARATRHGPAALAAVLARHPTSRDAPRAAAALDAAFDTARTRFARASADGDVARATMLEVLAVLHERETTGLPISILIDGEDVLRLTRFVPVAFDVAAELARNLDAAGLGDVAAPVVVPRGEAMAAPVSVRVDVHTLSGPVHEAPLVQVVVARAGHDLQTSGLAATPLAAGALAGRVRAALGLFGDVVAPSLP